MENRTNWEYLIKDLTRAINDTIFTMDIPSKRLFSDDEIRAALEFALKEINN